MSLKIHIANINLALNKFVLNSLILCDYFFYETASCPGMNWFPFCHLQTHLSFISRIRDLKLSKDLFNIQLEKTRDLYFIKQNHFIFALCVNSKKFCLPKGFFLPISILKKNSQPLMSAVLKEKKRQIGIKYSLNSNYTLCG